MKKKFERHVLEARNTTEFEGQVAAGRVDVVYSPLLRVIADVADMAAAGENVWLSIGTTLDKTSYVLTVHSPEGKLTAYAASIGGLAMACNDLL